MAAKLVELVPRTHLNDHFESDDQNFTWAMDRFPQRKPDQSAISSGRMTLKHFIDPMKITSPRWTRTHPKIKLNISPVTLI